MSRRNRYFASRNFFFEQRDARLQFVRGKCRDILAQLNLWRFLARSEIVQIHRRFLGVKGSTR